MLLGGTARKSLAEARAGSSVCVLVGRGGLANLMINSTDIDVNMYLRFLFSEKASGSVFPTIVKAKLGGKTNVHKSLFWGTLIE